MPFTSSQLPSGPPNTTAPGHRSLAEIQEPHRATLPQRLLWESRHRGGTRYQALRFGGESNRLPLGCGGLLEGDNEVLKMIHLLPRLIFDFFGLGMCIEELRRLTFLFWNVGTKYRLQCRAYVVQASGFVSLIFSLFCFSNADTRLLATLGQQNLRMRIVQEIFGKSTPWIMNTIVHHICNEKQKYIIKRRSFSELRQYFIILLYRSNITVKPPPKNTKPFFFKQCKPL